MARLGVLCTFDTGERSSIESGLLAAAGALFVTSNDDTWALDPDTCRARWHAREPDAIADTMKVSRGIAYLDGRVFRGTEDGRVVAYDARTGRRLWSTRIADPDKGELAHAAPLAWRAPDGAALVFEGVSGHSSPDNVKIRGRMYAFDAATGAVRWKTDLAPRARRRHAPYGRRHLDELHARPRDGHALRAGREPGAGPRTPHHERPRRERAEWRRAQAARPLRELVPVRRDGGRDARTGAFRTAYPVVEQEYDVSAPPVVTTRRDGTRLLAAAPKDGYVYALDLATGRRLFRTAVTTVDTVRDPLSVTGVRTCPGTQGGSLWNGPAYDATRDLLYTGSVDWRRTARAASADSVLTTKAGQWAGQVTATDAATGRVRWRYTTLASILSGVTPTAGGLVLVGDVGAMLYALDAARGTVLWSRPVGGALAGGVITYATPAGQRIAAEVGMTSPIWPTDYTTAKVVVFGVR